MPRLALRPHDVPEHGDHRLSTALWQLVRLLDPAWTPRGALPTLAVLIVPLGVAIGVTGSFAEIHIQSLVHEVAERLPDGAIAGRAADQVALILALFTVMVSTGNAIVRLALAGIGTPVASSRRGCEAAASSDRSSGR